MKKIVLLFSLGLSLAANSQNLVIDPTFNTGTGFDWRVAEMQLLEDGKIMVAGNFGDFNGTDVHGLVRLNADGSLDTSFSINVSTINYGDIIVEDDGKVLAVGEFAGINRFNPDGSFDTTFSPPSLTSGGVGPAFVEKQGDKYIITGDFQVVIGTSVYRDMIRLNYNGTVDTTFTPIEFWNSFNFGRIIVQEDGKLFIAGNFTYYDTTAVNGLMRLTADGQLDTTFNAGTGAPGHVRAAVQLADGSYIISGTFETFSDQPAHLMVKLNNDGSRDTTFNYAPNAGLPEDGIIGIVLLPQDDGKLLVAGNFKDAMMSIDGTPDGSVPVYLCRLNADGSVDTTFKGGDKFEGSVEALAFPEDGKILAGGMFIGFDGTPFGNIARFTQEALSVNENSLDSIKAFPNPVSDILYIDGAEEGAVVEVYNLIGSSVYKGSLSQNAFIDMSALSQGMYIVKLQLGNKVFTQKVIKQ